MASAVEENGERRPENRKESVNELCYVITTSKISTSRGAGSP